MSSASCAICLEDLKEPMSIPCGHVHCFDCLERHIQANSEDALESTCPTCRATFSLVVPIMRHVPERFHKFITPTIRRIYLDVTDGAGHNAELEALRARIQTLEREAARRERYSRNQLATERALRKEAEEHFEQERASRERVEKLLHEEHGARKRTSKEYSAIKTDYFALKKKLDTMTEAHDKAIRLCDETYEKYDDLKLQFRMQQNARLELENKLAEATAQRDTLERLYSDVQRDISSKKTADNTQLSWTRNQMDTHPRSRRALASSWTQSFATLPADSDSEDDRDDDFDPQSISAAPRTIRPLPRRAIISSGSITDMESGSQGVRRPREEDEPEVPGIHKRTRLFHPQTQSLHSSIRATGPSEAMKVRDTWDGSFLSVSSVNVGGSGVCACSKCRHGRF